MLVILKLFLKLKDYILNRILNIIKPVVMSDLIIICTNLKYCKLEMKFKQMYFIIEKPGVFQVTINAVTYWYKLLKFFLKCCSRQIIIIVITA